MYSVSEVAKKLNVSRVTIYRNIETLDLQQYVTTKNSIKYIDIRGFECLKEKLGCNNEQECNSNNETTDLLHKLQMLQVETGHLKHELESKDKHIDTLMNETEMLQRMLHNEQEASKDLRRLIENSQVLLKQQQDKIFLLESPKPTKLRWKFWA
jgi:predicted RNase H-like nuclease (RuvC/YqgF family)